MIKRSALTEILFKRQIIIKINFRVIQIISIILIVYLIVIGTVLYARSKNLFEYKYRVDDNCIGYPCEFYMRADKDLLSDNLYVYIGFEEFFVNHRKVIYSIDFAQLEGTSDNPEDAKENCEDYYSLEVLNEFFPDIIDYEPEEGVIKPCGLFPLLYTQCEVIR